MELNIELLKVNNFNIKQKKGMECIYIYIICHQHQTRPGKLKTNKQNMETRQISVTTQDFVRKNLTTTYLTTTLRKLICIIFVNIYFRNH